MVLVLRIMSLATRGFYIWCSQFNFSKHVFIQLPQHFDVWHISSCQGISFHTNHSVCLKPIAVELGKKSDFGMGFELKDYPNISNVYGLDGIPQQELLIPEILIIFNYTHRFG